MQAQLNLTWIYEPSQESKEGTPPYHALRVLAPSPIRPLAIAPPYLDLAALYELAVLGHMRGIRAWTIHIEQVYKNTLYFQKNIFYFIKKVAITPLIPFVQE
jgi:hypothetical protein